jgi:class 3 adenylate cyclase
MRQLPSGTVTLLFTDIEGSTRLLEQLGTRYEQVLVEHRRLIRDAVATHHGVEVDTQGDAFLRAFSRASDAVQATPALPTHNRWKFAFGRGARRWARRATTRASSTPSPTGSSPASSAPRRAATSAPPSATRWSPSAPDRARHPRSPSRPPACRTGGQLLMAVSLPERQSRPPASGPPLTDHDPDRRALGLASRFSSVASRPPYAKRLARRSTSLRRSV